MTSPVARKRKDVSPSPADLASWMPCPLVEWTQLSTSVAPDKSPSRSRLRTLRAKKQISDGVKVAHRGESGMVGASSYYSVLALWAERARSRGFDDDAATLTSAASVLEEEFGDPLREYLGRHSFDDLPEADFFWAMADRTLSVLIESKTWHDAVVAVASVTGVDDRFAHLEGASMEGQPRSVDLPRHLAESNRLAEGSCVYVVSRAMGAGAFVEVDAAMPSRQKWLEGFRPGCFEPADLEAEPVSVSSDEPQLRDYNAEPGAPLTRDLAEFAWRAVRESGLEPTPLRPAG